MNILDRLALLPLLVTFVLFAIPAKAILVAAPQRSRIHLFAALNLFSVFVLIVAQTAEGAPLTPAGFILYLKTCCIVFVCYLLLVLSHYVVLVGGVRNGGRWSQLAFWFPLLCLCAIKYLPPSADPLASMLFALGNRHRTEFFVGISYMAFRLSYLQREVENGVTPCPSLAEYLSFAFFIPTMTLGPINSYANMHRSIHSTIPVAKTADAWLRILMGLTKYLFLASLVNQLTYDGLLLDGHPHARIDLFIAVPAYALYLYCNFSGFCDMVIGVSALLGIEVSENFNRPFTARNLQDFWGAWHITLSTWFREMMFTPMCKALVRIFGPRSLNHAIAFTMLAVFLTLGIWHGMGLNFVIFGLLQGIGLVTVHYYRILLRRRLSKAALATYQANRGIRVLATVCTFSYFAMTLFFFANSTAEMHRIAAALV